MCVCIHIYIYIYLYMICTIGDILIGYDNWMFVGDMMLVTYIIYCRDAS